MSVVCCHVAYKIRIKGGTVEASVKTKTLGYFAYTDILMSFNNRIFVMYACYAFCINS